MNGLVQKILDTCERVANKFLHPGANYTYMYNLHTVCKSAHVNGALDAYSVLLHNEYISLVNGVTNICFFDKIRNTSCSTERQWLWQKQT